MFTSNSRKRKKYKKNKNSIRLLIDKHTYFSKATAIYVGHFGKKYPFTHSTSAGEGNQCQPIPYFM